MSDLRRSSRASDLDPRIAEILPTAASLGSDLKRSSRASDLDPRIVENLPTAARLSFVGQCPCSRGRLSGNAHARVDFCLCHSGQCPCSHGGRGGSLPRECPCSRGGRGVGRGAPGNARCWSNAHAPAHLSNQLVGGLGANLTLPTEGRSATQVAAGSLENPKDIS